MTNTENKCEITMNGKTYPCHISMAMDLVGGKWKGVILYYLKDGPKRFNEINQLMPTITEMTELGQSFKPVLESLSVWAHTMIQQS
ncbi:helix-turn-helix transcriptional regulator [Acinetobacter baumannii]|uniref:winged helix-turn-helix transcriptional regulator n=1 Tax=Acinetobacter baumannii TaxID=470 RepID=UPI001B9DC406|nr:helix-turn-helix domain-containing protein [Acinetobacter baumannii]MBR8591096.1 helix-turn-helix transcriptional regulator [Acinetobacter baumannii]MCO9047455.1 helix-turn-helix transcriptional regulator [Acinetobacter baumannii]MCO9054845.1 helix-turn-helix transcriptional regulator [Acinetobacter baumannii]MCO9058448.1 helix-turn-helix transcriptional regulator [Acinetobacter baumannii]MCO9062154.1 helix-turn-helix transcriptional regulator [Acinetobacter baumannii]